MRTPPALALLASLFACGSGKAQAPTSNFQAAKFIGRTREAPPPPPLRVVPYDKVPDDPRAAEMLRDNFSSDPAAVDRGPPPELTKAALEDTARGEARGLELVDKIHVAELDEKRRAVISLPVTRGDCLTVIAHGGIGVMEVDAFLTEHGATPPKILAEDARAGPIAVIGGLRGCYPFTRSEPSTLDVIVQARKGGGPVVFAVYRGRP